MARILTEEEVERLEKQRGLQERERRALAGMSPDSAMRYREAQERQHWDDMYRQSHGGLSRAEVRSLGPDGSGRQAAGIARAAELRAAHERQKDIMGTEDVTRIEEARQRRLGMENQGVGAATIRAQADKDILSQNLADKEKQRQHEQSLLKQNQEFTGSQNDAERKNKLAIAQEQGDAAVDAATVQAQAQEKRLYAENMMRLRNVDEKTALQFAEQRSKMINDLIKSRTNKLGKPSITEEEAAKIIDERMKGSLPGTERRPLASFGA